MYYVFTKAVTRQIVSIPFKMLNMYNPNQMWIGRRCLISLLLIYTYFQKNNVCMRKRNKLHSASLGRFVPHHASAVWCTAPLHRTIFRLNLEKKWLRPSACLYGQRLTGGIFIIHCSYLVIPKRYFIEIEVNSIKGRYMYSP